MLIDLEIPTLPKGRQLTINIKNTWGDRHYVGLNGIEVFTEFGKPAEIAEISADPPDINILPEYGNDPRVVTNLIDGVYRTRDDMHLWLAPFTLGGKHTITLTFTESLRIAMIRIWNYNKSRIHSFRGVRFVDITLDDDFIFQGEIARASGILGPDDPFGDTILFTMDEEILETMAQYDQTYDGDVETEDELLRSCYFERPSTADLDEHGVSLLKFTGIVEHRNTTLECSRQAFSICFLAYNNVTNNFILLTEDGAPKPPVPVRFLEGRVLQLNFVSTWGDPYYLGLTGLEVLGPNSERIPLSYNMLTACPADLNDLPEYEDDDRTLDKLIDGTNVTTSDEHMWLVPFTDGQDHLLTIDMGRNTPLVGLKFWNYNKSTDDSFRGAREVHVKLDDRIISPQEGFLLRKGPGNVHFDHGQEIYLIKSPKENSALNVKTVDVDRRFVVNFFQINFIYVVFDEPSTVSMVKVWNYSKTPMRGVQQFGLLVDDLLVYHGILPQVPSVTRGILPNLDIPIPHHTVLFTDQEQIALAERKNVLSNKGGEQDIQLTNDKRVVSHYNEPKSTGKAVDPALRPKTSVLTFQKKR
ncbi:PREDICTED: uncharacterized protein KIAA0556-like [Acropora digitifera]|uniref:uncharacterized protein KIAA0556-like n=1 Tax=Acropora digitifera TaxID=70779 RepID=UPI00077B04BA|nr:PREDICTED: uncharacterized protein KIAA0556-like [Acropora digitifera]